MCMQSSFEVVLGTSTGSLYIQETKSAKAFGSSSSRAEI